MPMARLSPSHDCSHVAASSHRRRCPFWSPLGARAPRPCSSKAVVYADSSCLARKVAVVSDISVGGPGRARDRPKGANLLYSFLCAAQLRYKDENRCIKVLYTDTRCVTAPHSYTAIQAPTALYTIQLYSALYTIQPLQHPSEKRCNGGVLYGERAASDD